MVGQVYVGPPEEDKLRNGANASNTFSLLQYPLWIITAVLIGAGAVVLSRLARYYVTGGGLAGENADIVMVVDGVFALAIVIALRRLLSVNGFTIRLAKAIGVLAMIGLMHALVHEAPKPFAKVFSQVWVDDVVATTNPRSVLFLSRAFLATDGLDTRATGMLADLEVD